MRDGHKNSSHEGGGSPELVESSMPNTQLQFEFMHTFKYLRYTHRRDHRQEGQAKPPHD